MYSIPQHAVTKGYWKIEYFRAQPIASSRRLVKNDVSFAISLPLQGAVVPGVNEAHHQDSQKDRHLDQAHGPQRAGDRCGQHKTHGNPDVFVHKETTSPPVVYIIAGVVGQFPVCAFTSTVWMWRTFSAVTVRLGHRRFTMTADGT